MSVTKTIRLFSGEVNPKSTLWTVGAIVDQYLEAKGLQVKVGTYSPKSIERAERYLKSFCEMFGKANLDDCRRRDLLDWLIEHPEWEATFTRQDAVGAVVTCFIWAEDELKIRSPYRRPRFLGPPVRPRPAILPAEYLAMRQHARKGKTKGGRLCRTRIAFRAMLCFLWKTGCRTCEAREAEWDSIDWARGVLDLSKHKTALATGDTRLIPIRRVLPLLRWLLRNRRRGQRTIFANTLGRPWSCDRFAKEFRRFARLAGIREEVSAYCLRHGLCVRLLEKGTGERQIADVMGHKTTKYISWYGRSTKTKADYLNKVLESDK